MNKPKSLTRTLFCILVYLWQITNLTAQDQTYPIFDPSVETVKTEKNTPVTPNVAILSDRQFFTCTMTYSLKGFSLAYKQYDGAGEVACNNGNKVEVTLSSKSIGFTIGASEIEGEGYFTDLKNINEIFGDYISLGNHFGFINSIDREVLTKGEVSLVLLGKGKGFDIGFTIGDLSIRRR